LKKKIASFYEAGTLTLDFSEVNFVDHNVMHHLEGIREDWKRENKSFELKALDELTPVSEYPTAGRKRGGKFEVKISNRDKELMRIASERGYQYNFGSIFGYEFKNFKLLSNMTIDRAHNVIMGPNFQIADVEATERLKLEGGAINFTAFVMPKTDKPSFRLGNLSFFDSLQELFVSKDIKFENHPEFENHYFLTSDDEVATRQLFSSEVLEFLEIHREYKIEVNDQFILIFKEQCILSVQEINELIDFSSALLKLFAVNLKK
jgi:hypothetical protein